VPRYVYALQFGVLEQKVTGVVTLQLRGFWVKA